jgi:hypothetical protein
MTERSRPWDGTTTGDATDAPYDAATEWARIMRATNPAMEATANKGGVVVGATGFNDLTTSSPGANTQRVQTGIAWVQGTWYENDANVDVTIPTPATATRIDRIVLRKSWAGQTIRITRIAGTEGGGAPALVQTFGTTWDVPLYQVSITTGGVMTLTDQRESMAVTSVHTHASAGQGGSTLTSPTINTPTIGTPTLNGVVGGSSLGSAVNQIALGSHAHGTGGYIAVDHTLATNIGTNTHAQIDTHMALGLASGAHNGAWYNSTGTQSLGTPTLGKWAVARANGGTLTITTPSGLIVLGTTSGSSLAITNGDSFLLFADGTNWYI